MSRPWTEHIPQLILSLPRLVHGQKDSQTKSNARKPLFARFKRDVGVINYANSFSVKMHRGEKPVPENPSTPRDFLSNTMNVKLRMNLRRPRPKPKYSLATDSGQVPRGKGEKNRCDPSEAIRA